MHSLLESEVGGGRSGRSRRGLYMDEAELVFEGRGIERSSRVYFAGPILSLSKVSFSFSESRLRERPDMRHLLGFAVFVPGRPEPWKNGGSIWKGGA